MLRRLVATAAMGLLACATPVTGQDNSSLFLEENPDDGVELIQTPNPLSDVTSVTEGAAENGTGAVLRALDKTLARSTDIEMAVGQTVVFGRVAFHLQECRYPADNAVTDAFAHIQVLDLDGVELFNGWMIASSPALVALEHPRYDVWVLNCSTS